MLAVITHTSSPRPHTDICYILHSSAIILSCLVLASPSVRSALLTRSLSSICGNSLHPPKSISSVTFSVKPFLKPLPPPVLFLFWTPALRLCSLKVCHMFPAFWLTLHTLTTRRYIYLSRHFTHLYILWESNLQRWVAITVEPAFINLSHREKKVLCVSTCIYFHRLLLPSLFTGIILDYMYASEHFSSPFLLWGLFTILSLAVREVISFVWTVEMFLKYMASLGMSPPGSWHCTPLANVSVFLFRDTSLYYFLSLLTNQMIRKQVKSVSEVSRMKLPASLISTFGIHSRVIVSGEKAPSMSITSAWQPSRLMPLQQLFQATFPLI